MSVRLDDALFYAAQRFAVFPVHASAAAGACSCGSPGCSSPGKHPRTANGFKDATCDEEVIRSWFGRTREVNLAVATGASHLVVIDVDEKHGVRGLDSWAEIVTTYRREHAFDLEDTCLVETPSGGLHVYYRANGHGLGCSVGKLAAGIDVRAEGGYVLVPPSAIAGIPYSFVEGHGLERLRELPDVLARRLRDLGQGGSRTCPPEADAPIPEGQRNDTLFRDACAMRRRGHTEGEIRAAIAETNKRCQPPLDGAELVTIVTGALTYEPAASAKEAKEAKEGLTHVERPWPAALGPAAYHGPLGELVRVLEPCNEADPAALLVNAIVGFGSLLGAEAHICVGSDRHPPRLFALLVGDTAKARKGMSWNPIYDALTEIDPTWGERVVDGLASGEGLIWHVRDPISQMVKKKVDGETVYQEELTDPGVSDKRLFVGEGEFARVLQVMSRAENTLSAVLRNAWDKGDLRTLTKNSPAKASGAHISIVGHITGDELVAKLTSSEAGNGFGNRFLFASVRRSKCLPHGGRPDPEGLAPIIAALREAREFASTVKDAVGEIHWAADADELWVEVYAKLSEGRFGLVGALTARAEAQVLRLALIYALADCSEVIRRVHLEAALELWRYCEESVAHIFGERSGDALADEIMSFLHTSGPMARTQISEHFQRHRTAAQIEAALRLLLKLRRAAVTLEPTQGRSREVWRAC